MLQNTVQTTVHPTKHCQSYKKCTSRPIYPSTGSSSSALKHLFIYRMIRLFVQPCIYSKTISLSINQSSINQSKLQYLRRTMNLFIERSINRTIYLVNKPFICQSKHFSLRPTIDKISRFVETSTYPSNPYLFVELSTYP